MKVSVYHKSQNIESNIMLIPPFLQRRKIIGDDFGIFCPARTGFVRGLRRFHTKGFVICLMRIDNLCKGCASYPFVGAGHFRFQLTHLHNRRGDNARTPSCEQWFRFTFKNVSLLTFFVPAINKSSAKYGWAHVQVCCCPQVVLTST